MILESVASVLLLAMPAQLPETAPETVCAGSPCAPPWAAVVLVFVTDDRGAPIQDVAVTLDGPSPGAGAKEAVTRTDRAGMAALSLEAGFVGPVVLSAGGFEVVEVMLDETIAGTVRCIRATLKIDSSQVRGVLDLPTER